MSNISVVVYGLLGGILVSAAAVLPVLGFAFYLLYIVLAGYITYRKTVLHTLGTVLIAGSLPGLLAFDWFPLVVVLTFGLTGAVYGLCFKNALAPGTTLAAGIVATGVLWGLNFWVTAMITGDDPLEMAAVPPEMEGFPAEWQQAVEAMAVLYPASVAISAFCTALIAFFAIQWVLTRQKIYQGPSLDFSEWRMPWGGIWILIIGLVLLLAGDQWLPRAAADAGKNILFAGGFVFTVSGLALFVFLYRRLQVSKFWRLMTVIFIIFYWPIIVTAMMLAGIVDAVYDFRTRIRKKGDKA
ncbi:MAG: DUF2232 domain-containing protein [Peptococcaceae bacterium]|nr:DUF2232 domain-containing protein [Peptococcaceae bacterium]